MTNPDSAPPKRVRRVVARLFEALDRALAAFEEVRDARKALTREAGRLRTLRVIRPGDSDHVD